MQQSWWQNAVIYQIYPRSFYDSSGDGVGDLKGIVQRLDYIASLNVDAIWVSPFYPSPMQDFGYDVSDYCGVDPMFGSLEDFKELLNKAHQRGLKVLLDQVWCHSSEQHPWFLESKQDRHNSKADWYVWSDPKPNGDPPNNWLATFGGQAWSWHPAREQYYLHHFLSCQPALNWHNPKVQEAMLEVGRFWLELGVDGFRFDVINFLMHDRQLRDNPIRPADQPAPAGGSLAIPFFRYINRYNIGQDITYATLPRIRQLLEEFPHTTSLAEISSAEEPLAESLKAVGPDCLHMAYNSALMTEKLLTAEQLRDTLRRAQPLIARGGLCWTAGTHDFPRLASRWHQQLMSDRFDQEAFNLMLAVLMVGLPGSTCIYQGDELGLPEAQLAFDQLRDPFGIRNYPQVAGRDGCRTPLPWHRGQPHHGFSDGPTTWLPAPQDHEVFAVSEQERQPSSLLNQYRRLLQWRREQPALNKSLAVHTLETQPEILGFTRGSDTTQPLTFLFNFTDQIQHQPLDTLPELYFEPAWLHGGARQFTDTLELPPHGVLVTESGIPHD
ncbi:MAG: alpha-glucosidase [Pseudomonadales bacterium]|nr:alpha-glucosidase [Pseudomonadales bacterium]